MQDINSSYSLLRITGISLGVLSIGMSIAFGGYIYFRINNEIANDKAIKLLISCKIKKITESYIIFVDGQQEKITKSLFKYIKDRENIEKIIKKCKSSVN